MGLLLIAGGAQAAPPLEATARVQRESVQVGQPVRILLQIKNSEGRPEIDVPRADGLQINPSGSIQATPAVLRGVRPLPSGHRPGSKIVESFRDLAKSLAADPNSMQGLDPQIMRQYQGMLNQGLANVKYDDVTVVYLAHADRTGQVTVPPFTVRSGAETAQTEPITLTVTEARPQPWIRAAMSLSNPTPLVGEKVNVYFDLLARRWPKQAGKPAPYVSQPITNVTLHIPTLEGIAQIKPLQSLEQLVQKRVRPAGQPGYHINNYPGVILLEPEPPPSSTYKPDPQWHRRRLTFPVQVLKAGEVEVPPFRVAGEVYLDIDGKGTQRLEGFVAVSPPLKFRVGDRPQKAADPNGAVPLRPTPAPAKPAPDVQAPPVNQEPAAPAAAEERQLVKRPLPDRAVLWGGLAIVGIVALAVVVGMRRGRSVRPKRGTPLRQRRQLIEQARQRLRTGSPTAAEVSAAVQDFLRARLEMPPGEITPTEAAQRLTRAGYPPELAERCAEVLRACADLQFAPGATTIGANELAGTADRLLGDILLGPPRQVGVPVAAVDELTRQRQAALMN
jgi:hypothetical protein